MFDMTNNQEAFYRQICDRCDDIAARKSLSDQIEAERHILARIAETLTDSQIEKLSGDLLKAVEKTGEH